jgi:hypothetical protein
MAIDPLEQLWGEWLQEKLGQERAIGQILQHLLVIKLEIERLKQQERKGPADKTA